MAQSHKTFAPADIRDIAIVGHAGSGKTTLIEALLAKAGAIREPCSVAGGPRVCDFADQETRLKHCLDVAVCQLEHGDVLVNHLDSPVYPDLVGRTLAVLPSVDTAAAVVNAQPGVELGT